MAAARYGLLFKCDPMVFLDRDPSDAALMLALYEAAARDVGEANRGSG